MVTTFVSQLGHMDGLDASFLNRYEVIIAVFARHDIDSWSTANVFKPWLVIVSVQLPGTDLLHSESCLNLTGFLEGPPGSSWLRGSPSEFDHWPPGGSAQNHLDWHLTGRC